ncbi:hypothetical protein FHR38_005966 [Micromonospora polyrhachis]|uniref:Uncharacterized protein n=1 Tax=Micromonospora polyrhachis TaxID=1282883 RepID=A0A7W7SWG2_9ACTN|nr:hypothetical protein [Micromonospora polyrhachis]
MVLPPGHTAGLQPLVVRQPGGAVRESIRD